LIIFRKTVKKTKISLKSDTNYWVLTVHEDQYTFLVIYHQILLRMKNIADKITSKDKF